MENPETSDAAERSEDYEPPQVNDVPTPDGPAVTVPGDGGTTDLPVGPEWRPAGEREPGSSSEA